MPDSIRLDDVRERYAREREKRIREDATTQYVYVEHPEDPWVPRVEREPLRDHVEVTVVGAGISGLTCAVELRKAGVDSIRLVDRAGDVGGTWYWNRYPAAQCDVESYIYLPLLEDMGYIPSEKYVHQTEILDYLQSIAAKYDLRKDAAFQTEVSEFTWDDESNRWTVHTDRGDAFTTQFLVVAGGFLQRPKLPRIPGIEDFRGKVFHSSRWDYAYTGGGPGRDGGGLEGLADKRVGLVGTGATGLQIVAPVSAAAQELLVFQRTPSVVLPRNNRPTDPAWAEQLSPGWQRERIRAFNLASMGMAQGDDPVDDSWTQTVFPVGVAHGASLFGGLQSRRPPSSPTSQPWMRRVSGSPR